MLILYDWKSPGLISLHSCRKIDLKNYKISKYMYYLALWLYNYVNASAHAGKNKPLNSFKFTCVVYYMGTLTRHS